MIHPKWILLAVALTASGCTAPEMDEKSEQPAKQIQSLHSGEGKTVATIKVMGFDSPESFLRVLETRVGEPLSSATVAEDLRALWAELRTVVLHVRVEDAEGDRVLVTFHVQERQTGGEDQVLVSEKETGAFLWGAGVSTGSGVHGRFQFAKDNLDLRRRPIVEIQDRK